jgi:hypothetical protein
VLNKFAMKSSKKRYFGEIFPKGGEGVTNIGGKFLFGNFGGHQKG